MGEWWVGFEADGMRFGHWCRRGLSLVHETPCGSGERKRRGLALVQCPGKSGKVRTGADRGVRRSRSSGGQPCQPDVSTAMQCPHSTLYCSVLHFAECTLNCSPALHRGQNRRTPSCVLHHTRTHQPLLIHRRTLSTIPLLPVWRKLHNFC